MDLRTMRSERLVKTRLFLAATFLLSSAAAGQIGARLVNHLSLVTSLRWASGFGLAALCALASLALLFATLGRAWPRYETVWGRGLGALTRLGILNLPGFLLTGVLFAFLLLGPLGGYLKGFPVRLGFFWLAAWSGAVFMKAASPGRSWWAAVIGAGVWIGACYQVASFIPDVSTYPFSLGWSEASRYYYASLFFSRRIYGVQIPPSVLHPSRYLLQSIPFLLPGLPLWFHRLWQAILWVFMPCLTVFLLGKRLKVRGQSGQSGRAQWLLFYAWAFLFLFQGPVYYHLLVCAAIVLWGLDTQRFWRSLAIVALASAWAGISRINWFPLPGLLAASLYILENPLPPFMTRRFDGQASLARIGQDARRSLAYFVKPVLWTLAGTLVAFAAQAGYIVWSGQPAGMFTSSLSSTLLWYRLFPNSTYHLGILLAVLLAAGPLVALSYLKLRQIHPFRLLALGAILCVFLVGGIVVSAKIGGGSNLHNLDAFLVLLLVIGSYAYFGELALEGEVRGLPRLQGVSPWLLSLVLLVPALYAVSGGGPIALPDRNEAQGALGELNQMVHAAVAQGGEVLFISQRHLLTFGYLSGVPLVDDYEDVFLMEMVMADNQDYLNRFYTDIDHRRFSLIISDPIKDTLKGSEYSFGEENDAWVRLVSRPVLDTYRRKVIYKNLGIEVLEPKR
jgi:hypothetical protein